MPEIVIEHYRESWIPGRGQGPAGQALGPIDGAASDALRMARKEPEGSQKEASTSLSDSDRRDGHGWFWMFLEDSVCCCSSFRRVGLFLSETTE
jgi:hypothetical protein